MAICPICKRSFEPAENSPVPFCSTRCQLVDLGRWLGEDYAFPSSREREVVELDDDDLPSVDLLG